MSTLSFRARELQGQHFFNTTEADLLRENQNQSRCGRDIIKSTTLETLAAVETKLRAHAKSGIALNNAAKKSKLQLEEALISQDRLEASCSFLKQRADYTADLSAGVMLNHHQGREGRRSKSHMSSLEYNKSVEEKIMPMDALESRQVAELHANENIIEELRMQLSKIRCTAECHARKKAEVQGRYKNLIRNSLGEGSDIERKAFNETTRQIIQLQMESAMYEDRNSDIKKEVGTLRQQLDNVQTAAGTTGCQKENLKILCEESAQLGRSLEERRRNVRAEIKTMEAQAKEERRLISCNTSDTMRQRDEKLDQMEREMAKTKKAIKAFGEQKNILDSLVHEWRGEKGELLGKHENMMSGERLINLVSFSHNVNVCILLQLYVIQYIQALIPSLFCFNSVLITSALHEEKR